MIFLTGHLYSRSSLHYYAFGKTFCLSGRSISVLNYFKNYFYEQNNLFAASADAARAVLWYGRSCPGTPQLWYHAHGFPSTCQ